MQMQSHMGHASAVCSGQGLQLQSLCHSCWWTTVCANCQREFDPQEKQDSLAACHSALLRKLASAVDQILSGIAPPAGFISKSLAQRLPNLQSRLLLLLLSCLLAFHICICICILIC